MYNVHMYVLTNVTIFFVSAYVVNFFIKCIVKQTCCISLCKEEICCTFDWSLYREPADKRGDWFLNNWVQLPAVYNLCLVYVTDLNFHISNAPQKALCQNV